MKTLVISCLLHHANRSTKSQHFYKIKNMLLSKYGKHIGYDVQHIEGKKCFSCGGTGIYVGYNSDGYQYTDDCYRCYGGWYKRPVWNILERMQFGKYVFHQPKERVYQHLEITVLITGYIEHHTSKYGSLCLHLLYLIYESGYLKRYYKQTGIGWYCAWWRPSNWIPNLIHIIKHGKGSIPFNDLRGKFIPQHFGVVPDDDLPF